MFTFFNMITALYNTFSTLSDFSVFVFVYICLMFIFVIVIVFVWVIVTGCDNEKRRMKHPAKTVSSHCLTVNFYCETLKLSKNPARSLAALALNLKPIVVGEWGGFATKPMRRRNHWMLPKRLINNTSPIYGKSILFELLLRQNQAHQQKMESSLVLTSLQTVMN